MEVSKEIHGLQEVLEVGLFSNRAVEVSDGRWSLERLNITSENGSRSFIALECHEVPFAYLTRENNKFIVHAPNPYEEMSLQKYIREATGERVDSHFWEAIQNPLCYMLDPVNHVCEGYFISIKMEPNDHFNEDLTFRSATLREPNYYAPEDNEVRLVLHAKGHFLIMGDMPDINPYTAAAVKAFLKEYVERFSGYEVKIDNDAPVAHFKRSADIPEIRKAEGLESLSVPMPNMEVDINQYNRLVIKDGRNNVNAAYVPRDNGTYVAQETLWNPEAQKFDINVSTYTPEEVQRALAEAIEAHLSIIGYTPDGYTKDLVQDYLIQNSPQHAQFLRRDQIKNQAVMDAVYSMLSYDYNEYKPDYESGPYKASVRTNDDGEMTFSLMKNDTLIVEMNFEKDEGKIVPLKTVLYGNDLESKEVIQAVELFNEDISIPNELFRSVPVLMVSKDDFESTLDMHIENAQKEAQESSKEADEKVSKPKTEAERD